MKKTCYLFFTLALLCVAPLSVQADDVFVKIVGNQEFTGQPVELTEIKFTSGFGEVVLALETINGIKLNANANGETVVVLKNGDTITGKMSLDTIKIKTTWGQANINISSVDSVTFDKNGRFYSEKNGNATIWRFTNDPPVTEPQAGTRSGNFSSQSQPLGGPIRQ